MTNLILSLILSAACNAMDFPKAGDQITITSAATALRESTPDPTFGGTGRQIGWVKKGEMLRVLEARQYISVFGAELWLKVEKLGATKGTGWIRAGLSQELAKGNAGFDLMQSEKLESEEAGSFPSGKLTDEGTDY